MTSQWSSRRVKSPATPLFFNRSFNRTSKKISKLRATGLPLGNPPVTGRFPTQRASNTENVSILWRHHEHRSCYTNHQPQSNKKISKWPRFWTLILTENLSIAQVCRLSAVQFQVAQVGEYLFFNPVISVSQWNHFWRKSSQSDCVFQLMLALENCILPLHLVTSISFLKAKLEFYSKYDIEIPFILKMVLLRS